ncbi:MAG: ARMT1-like domain-containing protein, partial [Candidatus Subteraquimicrobiales bacterium]|nr:ARMT1-like domain-containing protein [Candidatus Subteraquimicrobiales bacterium]
LLLLPIYNHKFIDAFTSIIESTVENSVVFPGAGIPLRIEGSRTALVKVTLKNTVIPEDRKVEVGAPIEGLMEQERKLIEKLYYSSEEEALEEIKGILANELDKGRFTSVAVAMLALPQYKGFLSKIDQKDAEQITVRIEVIKPVLGNYLNMLMSGQRILEKLPKRTLKDFRTIAFKSEYLNKEVKLTNSADDEIKLIAYLLGYDVNDEPLKGVDVKTYFAGLFSHGEKKEDKIYANYVEYTLGVIKEELRLFAESRKTKGLDKEAREKNKEEIERYVEGFYNAHIDKVLEYAVAALHWIPVRLGYPLRDRLGNVQYLSIARKAQEAAIRDRSKELGVENEFAINKNEKFHPFEQLNKEGNESAINALMVKEAEGTNLSLEYLFKLVIAGGVFDLNNPDIKKEYQEFESRHELSKFFDKYIYKKSEESLATVDDYRDLRWFMDNYITGKPTKTIVYIFDNNFEGVFDLYLIQRLLEENPNLTIYAVVKESNVSNDFSVQDIKLVFGDETGKKIFAKLIKEADYLEGEGNKNGRFKVVTKGPNLQGIDLAHLSSQLKQILEQKDILVLTKGQANAECTQVEGLERLHVLMSKGETIASFTGLHKDAKGMVIAHLTAEVTLGKGKADTKQKCPLTDNEITVPKRNLVWWRKLIGDKKGDVLFNFPENTLPLLSYATGLSETWDEAIEVMSAKNKSVALDLTELEEKGRIVVDTS